MQFVSTAMLITHSPVDLPFFLSGIDKKLLILKPDPEHVTHKFSSQALRVPDYF